MCTLARQKSLEVFGTSLEVFGHLRISWKPLQKILALLGAKCHAYEFKKVGRYRV